MDGQPLRAPDDDRFASLILNDVRRGVAVVALDRCLVVARFLPREFAGALVERREVRFTGVHYGEYDVFCGQHRRGADVPVQRVAREPVLQVGFPEQLTIQREAGEVAALEIGKQQFAVGDRGGVAAGAVAVFAGAFAADRGLPPLFAVPAERHQRVVAVARTGDDDLVLPDDWCRAALGRQHGFPFYVFLVVKRRDVTAGRG